MYKNQYISAIIAAAGMSNRMGSKINKQFISINDKPILAHAIEKFERCKYVDEIIVVAKEDEIEYCRKEIVRRYNFNKVTKIVRGGKERQDSVYNGILALDERCDIVLSHDGARPFVKMENIVDGIKSASEHGACVVGVPVKDTIKVVGNHNNIDKTPNRDLLWAAQTPQCFKKHIIMEGYRRAIEDGFVGTDDGAIVERLGLDVKMVMGSYENIKITTPEDLIIAESLVKDRDTIFSRREFAFQGR
ncbi:2-C-methyl-D-erythritol 4-phosphate cytidylyltransferase [Clostridium sp. Cult3]|uniref:2-C-methyl-D-erythritol 4-phosphate cytidylyltransferase n=1 Tax=Clostridium sp. Cult3 TaxID=2079004 RepID=UPI001F00250A|nr:2-C-methyl-D-erythritol 4-phosphate cytidylyltransferase [Clostridium sp. Cult3]MCF6461422.1 2-C-methyl-D-erythritol 4-phosphate cytidylyltransferase [Clostridium sp. Cult3]